MKFDQPRVFERIGAEECRVEFCNDSNSFCTCGSIITFSNATRPDIWREVTPTTDVTKLDTAGVFHEVPKRPERTHGQVCYETWAKALAPGGNFDPWDSGMSLPTHNNAKAAWEAAAKAVVDFDNEATFAAQYKEFNATIAELRARVAELEAAQTKLVEVIEEHTSWHRDYDIQPNGPGGCGCCCCAECRHHHDDCVCESNEIERKIGALFGHESADLKPAATS